MEEQELIRAARETEGLVEKLQLSEQYKPEAFRILLERRLGMRPATTRAIETPEVPEAVEEKPTFGEYYGQLDPEPKNNPERFASVADYYERYMREKSVTQDEIVDTMADADLDPPQNLSRDMRKARSGRKPLLRKAEVKNGLPAWQLTKTGRDFIKERLKE